MYITTLITIVLHAMGAFIAPLDLASEPLRTVYERDVDGDGKIDKLVYEITKMEDHYKGSLVITSATGQPLWEHEWGMTIGDLEELIETEGDVTNKKINLESWVTNFFGGELNYGARLKGEKLKASELGDEERLTPAAKYYRVSVDSLKQSILSQKVNSLISYRAEWREDLILLVYVPSVGKFVCYKRGY